MGRGRRVPVPSNYNGPRHRANTEGRRSGVCPSFRVAPSFPHAAPPHHPTTSPPAAWDADQSLVALTCPARALFHALRPAVAVRAWVSLLRSAAARQRVSPVPPPPPDLGAATQDRAAQITPAARRLGCASARARARTAGRAEAQPRAEEPPALRPAHTRAHAPRPRASRRHAGARAAGGTQRPNPQPRCRHTLSPHPLFFTVTRSPSAAQPRTQERLHSRALPNFVRGPLPAPLSASPHSAFPMWGSTVCHPLTPVSTSVSRPCKRTPTLSERRVAP